MDEHAAPILGRDEERDRIKRFLSRPRPAVLLVEGDAGIGKTTMWRHGVAEAERLGFTVLAFRPGEAERSLTFAGLAGLLPDSVLDEALPDIPGPRRHALEVALLRRGGRPEGVDSRTVGLGVLSVLELIAGEAPVLVAMDDLTWLDEPTVRVLEFALRRIGEADLAVLAARRTEGASAGLAPLEAAFPESARQRVALGPMSVGAIGRLVHDRLGLPLPRMVAARLHQESGGNPFIALELARAAAARGNLPAPGEPFPVTGDAASLIGDRLAGVSAEAREMLLVISALAHPTTGLLARTLGEEVSERSLEELVGADLVRVDGEDARCAHPLIASAAYSGALPSRRRRLHTRLAAAVEDVEERARHRALGTAGPDETVAGALDQAATLARTRGASGAAAELAELAVSLTPPADRPERARRELVLAEYRMQAGSVTEARDTALRAVELLPPGPDRVDPLLLLGRIAAAELGDITSGGRWFQQALDEAGDDRAALVRAHVDAGRWADELGDARGEREAEHARAALDLLSGHEEEDPYYAAMALVMLAEARFRSGRGLDVELLDRAVELEPESLPIRNRPSTERAIGLGVAGRHRASIKAIEACLARAEQEGDWGVRPLLFWTLARTEWWTGNLPEAAKHIDLAEELAAELGMEEGIIWAVGAPIRAAMGLTEDARVWSERAVRKGREGSFWWWELHGHAAIVFLELTTGNVPAAAGALSAAVEIDSRLGHFEPGWDRIQGDFVEAFLGMGQLHEAADTTALLEDRAASGRHPWSLVVSARCRGLVSEANGDTEQALECFDRSLAADELGEMALERARTLLAKGRVLRRTNQRRAAREALGEAMRTFESCGAAPWAEKARRELAGVSGRVASATELTGTERRVAELAAAGRTNSEIAKDLFVSVRTVESQLSAAYRKLGVRSRTELAAALSRQEPTG
jgi:DNA-binding CsgD family transcriptional regulator